jgi:hypothetical protein
MAGKNFLSDEAVSSLVRMGQVVNNHSNRLSGGMDRRMPNLNRQKYARIDTHITDNSYAATQVYYTDGTWAPVVGGNTWGGGGADDLTALLSFDNSSGNATGVHPVYVFGDSTANWWGFEWFDAGEFEDVQFDFQGTLDGTDLTINGGFVSIESVSTTVADFSTDGAAPETYWIDITASMNEGSYTFGYSIDSTINSGDISPIWDEDSVTGDITWHLKIGELALADGTGALAWNQEWIGAMVLDGLDPGTVIADEQEWSNDFFATYDDQSVDRVVLNYATIDMTTQRGLVANLEYTDIDEGLVISNVEWLGFEPAAIGVHRIVEVTDASDDLKHWCNLEYDGTTATATVNQGDGTSAPEVITGTTFKLSMDIMRHVHKVEVDGTEIENPFEPDETGGLPPAYVNYRYRHCTDTNEPDIILQEKTASDYWSDENGECYYFTSETQIAGVAGDPSIEDFASCEECDESAAPVRQFADCATSVLKRVNFAPDDAPDSDFVWIDHDGTAYEKFLEVVPGGDKTPTDPVPCFTENSSDEVPSSVRFTPVACNQITIAAFSDTFDGSYPSNTPNPCKWLQSAQSGGGTAAQTGGVLRITANSTTSTFDFVFFDNIAPDISGAFTCEADWAWSTSSGGSRDFHFMRIRAHTSGGVYSIQRVRDDLDANPNEYRADKDDVETATAITSDNSGTFVITKDGSNNLSVKYGTTTLYTWAGVTDDVTKIDLLAGNRLAGVSAATMDWQEFRLQ